MNQPSANCIPANSKGIAMNSRLTKSLLAAACALAPIGAAHAAPPSGPSTVMRPAAEVVLSIGRGQLVTTGGRMADVFVANESVADVQIKSERQLYVFGKAGGETTVYASDAAGNVIWSANVRVGNNIESVDQMLALAMPEAKVAVSTMGTNTVLLTGTVAAPEDAAEAQRLVKAYVGDNTNVISRLRTATPLQVNLQVRFAEVSRSLVREMTSNLMTRDTTGGFQFGISRGRAVGDITGAKTTAGLPLLDPSTFYKLPAGTLPMTPFDPSTGAFVWSGLQYGANAGRQFNFLPGSSGQSAINLAGHIAGLDLLSALDLGERVGLVSTLSQPNLTALSGETADFLAGGEYPIPISQGLGSTSIEYKKYGVSLAYTPTVLANGRISIRVRPEVSELSSQGAVQLNGFTVPALTIRRAETTVELGSGQAFMIAGLLSNNAQNTIEKTPGAGDLPILGSLFRSTSFRKGETELVIIVTPYLVNPINANDVKLPTDGYNSPNELQRVLGNMDNNGVTGGDRPKPTAADAPAPNPTVSMLEAPAATPAPEPRTGRKPRKARTQASADGSATPGFNLD